MVLEIDLYDFITESEHNSMSGSHPFLDVDNFFCFPFFEIIRISVFFEDVFGFVVTLKVRPEML
jgi:hypothetical protein